MRWSLCRVTLAGLIVQIAALPVTAEAQPGRKVHRVGYLCPWVCPTLFEGRFSLPLADKHPDNLMADEAFRLGMRDLGYIEGQTLAVEWRGAGGRYDRLPTLAVELARLKVDVLVTVGGPWLRDFARAHRDLPIVLAQAADPVMAGVVASLHRPGANITGLSMPSHELEGKQLELLKEAVPGLSRVAVLYNPDSPASTPHRRETEAAARALQLQVQFVPIRGPEDFQGAFSTIRHGRAGALLMSAEPVILAHQVRLLELAGKDKLPTISDFRDLAELGGLMTYGPNANEMFRRAASFVDKILRGAKPGELPMEEPMRFEMTVNLTTARTLGLTIPDSILMRADRRIP